jgi:hypothetical protein
MEVHRIGVKFFAADPASAPLDKFIPVFHNWIQRQSVAGHLLIDVHDYRHLHQGPGILLVAHEGNFSIDATDGKAGLLYYRKTPTGLSAVDHLTTIFKSALHAKRLLEKDAKMQFDAGEFAVVGNDRLHAPNSDEAFAQLKEPLAAAIRQMFEGAEFQLSRTSVDPKERLTITCKLAR